MLKFGLEIALGMIQKSGAAIFEILIFRDFSGGQSPKFSQIGRQQSKNFAGKYFAEARFGNGRGGTLDNGKCLFII